MIVFHIMFYYKKILISSQDPSCLTSQRVLVVMGTFTRPAMANTVLDLVPCYSTEEVLVAHALRSDVLITSCFVSSGAHLSFLLPQISALLTMDFHQIMVGGAISLKNTLRCQRLHLVKLQIKKLILSQFNSGGINIKHTRFGNVKQPIGSHYCFLVHIKFDGKHADVPFLQGEVCANRGAEIHSEWKCSLLSSPSDQCGFGW